MPNFHSNKCEILFDKGLGLYRAGRLQEAEKIFREILSLDSRHLNALQLLGGVQWEKGNYEAALPIFDQYVQARPNDATAFLNRGLTLQHLKRRKEALENYRQAILLRPNYIKANMVLGILLDEDQDRDQAVSFYRLCAAMTPSSLEEARIIATAHLKLGDWARALEYCPHPPFPPAHLHDGFPSLAEAKKAVSELPELRVVNHPSHCAKPTVLVVGDMRYITRFFNRLRDSLRRNSPDINLHLHAMLNGSEDGDELAALLSVDTSISYEIYKPNDKAGFTTRRFMRISQLLEHLQQPILCLDIDSEVVGKIQDLFETLRPYDVGVFHRRSETSITQLVAAGLLYVSSCEGAIKFCSFLINYFWYLERAGKLEWFVDQIGILAATEWAQRNPGTVNIGTIPETVMTWADRSDGALIRTFKGEKKNL